MAAQLGQQLIAPEAGWKRYDDNTPSLKKTSNYGYVSNSNWYSGGYTVINLPYPYDGTENYIKFNFIGTKIRLISSLSRYRSNNLLITIDGVQERFGQGNTGSETFKVLCYEKTGLPWGLHTVTLQVDSLTTKRAYDNKITLELDAIDIDDTGRLLHPDEVTDVTDLAIGKRIRCHYQASSGQVGIFSGLGQETSNFIPVSPTATPNGDFYFICVDKDYLGRWKLIADRNIQTGISWDTLNESGVASGDGLSYSFSSIINSTIRLLTGGINATDIDNEWNKYIVNSTLNGTIIAGDNSVWNWNGIWSHTSTTNISGANRRTVRGYTSANSSSSILSNETTHVNTGFRPVLIIDPVIIKYLFKDGNDIKTLISNNPINWQIVANGTPTEDIFKNYGMDSLFNVRINELNLLDNPELLCWISYHNQTEKKLYITGLPYPKYRYKVEVVEPYTLLKDWSEYTDQNVTDYAIVPSNIITTINPYTIKVTVEQLADGKIIEAIGTVTLYDTEPTLEGFVQGLTVNLIIGDNENDFVQYYIKLNGQQIYPASGWSPLHQSPFETSLTLNQDDILIGQQNVLEIFARDEFGKESNIILTFIGDYSGIMFMDEQGNYYSNHLGEVLQYLDFGQIIAGRTTLPKKVRVVNKNGFPIVNLMLTLDTSNVTNNTQIEISKTEDPFIPASSLTFTNTLNYNDEVPIFVRIVTDKDAQPHSGTFDIIADADPA